MIVLSLVLRAVYIEHQWNVSKYHGISDIAMSFWDDASCGVVTRWFATSADKKLQEKLPSICCAEI